MANGTPAAPTPAGVSSFEWLTIANLSVIAIFAVLVIVAIVWGARLKSQRKAADVELREDAVTETRVVPNPAEITERETLDTVPVAPLASDPTPVVATAPFDPAPATIAADLATPPPPPAAAEDDLTRMKGVGPKLAAQLRDLGITRFDQIAALSPADADALDAQLGTFRGRLSRDRWIEQAGYLAKDDRAGFEAAFGKL
ncbi:hypothetical protein [Sphingomonas sp. RS2018]